MSTQIQYRAGEFQTFVTTREFGLPNGQKLPSGVEIEFDGTNARFEGNPPISMLHLRGAVKQNWLVPKAEFNPNAAIERPRSAGIKIHQAVGGNPMNPRAREAITTVDSEEQEVGGVEEHAQRTRDLNARKPKKATTAGRRVEGAVMAVDEMEGTVVNRPAFKTATRQGPVSLDNASQAISEMENVKLDAQPSVVGRVADPKNSSKEGFNVTNSVGGGVETFDLAGLDKKAPDQVMTIESEGLRFTTTNGPKKSVQPVTAKSGDIRRRVAKAMCPDFPDNYDFDASNRKKVARIQADFEDRPDVIQAVYAAESDEVKTVLEAEFPEAFA